MGSSSSKEQKKVNKAFKKAGKGQKLGGGDSSASQGAITVVFRSDGPLGLRLGGTKGGDILVSAFVKNKDKSPGAAERSGKLKIGDKLVRISATPVAGMAYKDAIQRIIRSKRPLALVFRRPPPSKDAAAAAALARANGKTNARRKSNSSSSSRNAASSSSSSSSSAAASAASARAAASAAPQRSGAADDRRRAALAAAEKRGAKFDKRVQRHRAARAAEEKADEDERRKAVAAANAADDEDLARRLQAQEFGQQAAQPPPVPADGEDGGFNIYKAQFSTATQGRNAIIKSQMSDL